MIKIRPARSQEDALVAYDLAYEFIAWLHERYPDMSHEIAHYLTHQKFDEQIRDVLVHYNPPRGECLLAYQGQEPVGILMLKDVGDGTCEMNRMFVRAAARGLGAGRALVQDLMERARAMGFTEMILGALPRHYEAIPLYRSCGFKDDDRAGDPGDTDKAILMKLVL
ncbi:MAG: GNAT family N-acetyltransferase [Pseudomonadota bacterium]